MLSPRLTPDFLKQLERLRLEGRRAFLGTRQGGHLSLKRGHGIEFSDYRQYELGDNPRHIDWGVYARSERLYVKRFREEENLTVAIILDCSASMLGQDGEKKWERACDVALAIAYVALMQQDSVRLVALGKKVTGLLFGARAIHEIGKELSVIKPSGELSFFSAAREAALRLKFPGVAICISDFLMPISETEKAFTVLRSRNLDITAVQVSALSDRDPLLGMGPVVAVDRESNREIQVDLQDEDRAEYHKLYAEHNRQLRRYCANHKIAFSQTDVESDLLTSVVRDLTATGLLV